MNDLNLLDKLSLSQPGDYRAESGRWLLCCVLIVGLFAGLGGGVAFRHFPPGSMAPIGAGLLGIVLASLVFPAIFFSLLDAPLGVRFAGLCSTVACVLAITTVGVLGGGIGRMAFDELARIFGPAIPGIVISAALPFVLVRYLLGWQLVLHSWHPVVKRQNVSIAGLLISMAVVALCVTCLTRSTDPGAANATCAIVAGIGLIFLLPLTYLVMRTRRYWMWYLAFCLIVLLVGFLVSLNVYLFTGNPMEIVPFLSVMLATGVAWLGLGLVALRLLGASMVLNEEIDAL